MYHLGVRESNTKRAHAEKLEVLVLGFVSSLAKVVLYQRSGI
jgi:hypothetical protein